jgi:hypothetical protein
MKRWPWKRIAWITGALVVVWFVAGVILAGKEPAPPPPGGQPINLRGGVVNGHHLSSRSWTFDYRNAQMSPDGTIATVDGVRHGVLYKKGKPYLKISAQHVSVNTQTLDFTALGQVHVEDIHTHDGLLKSFDTDLLQWTNATKMLLLQHPSLIRTGDQLLRVATITVDFNNNRIHFGKINGGFKAPIK